MANQICFDEVINRRNTNCAKWDTMDAIYGAKDLIHLGVADLDFKTPAPITEAFQACLDHGVYGYTDLNEGFYKGIIRWFKDKNHAAVKKEEIVFCPRISISVSLAVETFTNKGDDIIIHTPSYDSLYEAIVKNDRNPIASPLVFDGEQYQINFDELEKSVTSKTKMYILCSPFNPVGRVWKKEELDKIGEFCEKHNLILFVDEIHGDIVSPKAEFTTSLLLKESVRERLIVASSLTKTFNIPGVIVSYLIVPNETLRNKMKQDIDRLGMHNPNIFAAVAVEAGYCHCDDWYEEMLSYVNENEAFTREYFEKHFPEFEIMPREGTYLLWVSYKKLGCEEEKLSNWFIKKAKVEVYMGTKFGIDGKGCFRINLGSPKSLLKEAYERMQKAYSQLTV
ncbi:cystathionine beta-lyase [Hydrogenoanaerobacterium saccharovorans]|uniref:cysteine-S-conjugate beta-lyase n=1 Tax=Hydrogenoanaerobacterium saccharovorans TaxID=474960 RepID=A0A1H8CPK7_9FIRM|nr:MalY/PatB family protein [Hydrogenoanaerobacterium saccharovorans]RPF43239.1 cystathionine beta-lyase [Hydrogenoanaerobacterium saccharovorans]SEM96822.1 cystathione beta-lyase [Hydrogenoanaerobacterium saccharovorans]